ncbi:hypothetical protein HYFRA_00012285 [Hymenoscyphus fraxineus]|uniref:Uncharacterized protein n=1 Tax=Hymenoscyphus fraxineus TaxID=746836 RepID=A0A9N9KZ67_9HELO|nr:hypothetical protein HYFRA_00012285 [Hymenoscyphus fraxineus]
MAEPGNGIDAGSHAHFSYSQNENPVVSPDMVTMKFGLQVPLEAEGQPIRAYRMEVLTLEELYV